MRVALYARVSTKGPKADGKEQSVDTQLLDLRAYAQARGWDVLTEAADVGVSGARERRPGLDAILALARSRKIQAVCMASLDRWGRSLPHLVRSLEELQGLGVAFISLREGLDLSTPAGRLMFGVIASLAEYERAMIRERTLAGLRRVRAQGSRSGRPIGRPRAIFHRDRVPILRELGLTTRAIAETLGVSKSTIARLIARPKIMTTTDAQTEQSSTRTALDPGAENTEA